MDVLHFGCVQSRVAGPGAREVLSLHMGSDPVHIPPCRSRGCALVVLPGHTRSGEKTKTKTKNKKARILAESGPLD